MRSSFKDLISSKFSNQPLKTPMASSSHKDLLKEADNGGEISDQNSESVGGSNDGIKMSNYQTA